MRFNPSNFLYMIKQLVTGSNVGPTSSIVAPDDGGIKVDEFIPLDTMIPPNSLGLVITDNTTGTASTTFAAITGTYATDAPRIANALAQIAKNLNASGQQNGSTDSSKIPIYTVPSGTNQTVGTLSFPIPRDYDETSDQLGLRLNVALANADAGISLTAVATVQQTASLTDTDSTTLKGTAPFLTTTLTLTQTPQIVEFNLSSLGLKRDAIVAITIKESGSSSNGVLNVYSIERTYASCIVSFHDTDNFAETGNPLR